MDLMIGDNGTAQIPVQKEHDSAVELRVIPQLQKSGGFGIVFQVAGKWQTAGEMIHIHTSIVNYPSPKGNGLGRLSQKEPISVLQRPCIGSFCIFSLSNYGRIFLYHRKNFYSRTSSHWSMFPKCTACRLSTSTSCGKLFLMIRTPFSLSCFSPPPAMPPMVLSSVKTVPSL